MITRMTPMATPQRTNFSGFKKHHWMEEVSPEEKQRLRELTTNRLKLQAERAAQALENAKMELNDHLYSNNRPNN